MSDYIYKEPKGKLYKLSIRKWNSKFDCRGRWPFLYTCLWVDGDSITIHHYYTIWGKLLITLLYPVMVVMEGYKEANRELYRTWNDKVTGNFSSDECYRNYQGKPKTESWKVIEALVGRNL